MRLIAVFRVVQTNNVYRVKAGLQEFSEVTVKNADVLALTKKIRVEADPELSSVFPAVQAAVVTVRTSDGAYTDRVDFPKGEPENPLTDQEFRERYDGLMEYAGIETSVSSKVFSLVCGAGSKVSDMIKGL